MEEVKTISAVKAAKVQFLRSKMDKRPIKIKPMKINPNRDKVREVLVAKATKMVKTIMTKLRQLLRLINK
jgi:hypothetical protein